MAAISNHVSLTITADSVGITRAGFGVPLIVSHSAGWSERVREYNTLSDVATDFAVTTSPEYLMAQALFSQSPKPEKIKIGRADDSVPTKTFTITPTAVNSTVYNITCKGEGVTETVATYTSDASALVSEITAGLETALNAVAGKNFTATDNGTNITVDGDAAGDWFSLAVEDVTLLDITEDHADAGIATSLAAIALEDNDWYCLLTAFNSDAYVKAAAAWVETQKKIYLVASNETTAISAAAGGGELFDDLKDLNYERTSGWYHPDPALFLDCCVAGRCLPIEPGSDSWKFKSLSGVTAVTMTATQRANLVSKNANSYETVASYDMTFEGTRFDGDFIDTTRNIDWLDDDITKSVFEVLAGNDKVPFTNAGVGAVKGAIKGSLQRAVNKGILSPDVEPTVTAPLVEDVSVANKTARTLPDVAFSGTLAGAIHKVNITGVVSV